MSDSEATPAAEVAADEHIAPAPRVSIQILHSADFCAQNDLVGAQPILLRQFRRVQRADHHRLHGHFARIFRF